MWVLRLLGRCQSQRSPFSLLAIRFSFSHRVTMSDVLDRLQALRQSYSSLMVSGQGLADLSKQKVDFGRAHLGKTFLQIWEEEQKWLTWFLRTYGDSSRPSHQALIQFARLKTAELESDASFDPGVLPRSPAMAHQAPVVPKTKVKSQSSLAKEEGWEMSEPEIDLEQQVTVLSSRMDNMEGAIQQILQVVQAWPTKS